MFNLPIQGRPCYVFLNRSMLPQFRPMVKTILGNFGRIRLVCFHLMKRVVPVLSDQQRIGCTDKKPGIMEHLGHWFIIPSHVFQNDSCFTLQAFFSKLTSWLNSLEVWRTSKGFTTSSPKGRMTDAMLFPLETSIPTAFIILVSITDLHLGCHPFLTVILSV